MNEPLVSVIIPCYNVETYVQSAVQSILNQSYKKLEIWIIDDASVDDTLEKIRRFQDKRINVIEYKENTQKIGAVNDVLKLVTGDLICFQDADDWSEPNRIEEQVKQFKTDLALGICFTRYRYSGYKRGLPVRIALSNDELRDEFLEFGHKRNRDFDATACPTMMISQDALKTTKGYHSYFAGRVAEDIQWIYRILKEFKGITIDKVLYNYTIRKGSFTNIQFSGNNAKYAYSWPLLSKIIYKDIHEYTDVLSPENKEVLRNLELQSCEEALVNNMLLLNETKKNYESSTSFKIGKLILIPFSFIKYFFQKSNILKSKKSC